jgi:hypothetical protein
LSEKEKPMFCPQCGVGSEQPTRYCKTCGFKLDTPTPPAVAQREIVPGPVNREEAARQLRWLRGTRSLLIGTAFLPFAMFAVFVSGASNGGDQEAFAVIAFMFLLGSLGSSGWGLLNLWRGDFFKTFKERRVRAEAALLPPVYEAPKAQPVRQLPAQPVPVQLPPAMALPVAQSNNPAPSLFSASVTEHTTRSLQQQPGNSGKIR